MTPSRRGKAWPHRQRNQTLAAVAVSEPAEMADWIGGQYIVCYTYDVLMAALPLWLTQTRALSFASKLACYYNILAFSVIMSPNNVNMTPWRRNSCEQTI